MSSVAVPRLRHLGWCIGWRLGGRLTPGGGAALVRQAPVLAVAALVTLGYAGWVALYGHAPQPHRFTVSLVAYLVVGGAGALGVWRLLRLPGLPAGSRQGWRLLGVALSANWLGMVIYAVLDDVFLSRPLPLIANGAFVVFYAFMFLALLRFTERLRCWRERLAQALNATMVLAPGGMLLWLLAVAPAMVMFERSPWAALFNLCQPVANIIIMAGLATLLVQHRQPVCERALRALMVGMLIYIVGDIAFARIVVASGSWSGGPPNAAWIVATFLFGVAAELQRRDLARQRDMQPDMQPAGVPPRAANGVAAPPWAGVRDVSVLPYLSMAAGFGLLILATVEHAGADSALTAMLVAMGLLCGALLARQLLILREHAAFQAERSRRQSDARLSALVRHSRDVLSIVSADGEITYISPSALQQLGREAGKLVGRSLAEIVLPEDRPAVGALLADAIARPGRSCTAALRLLYADGSQRESEAIALGLLDDPAIQGIVVTLHDVTEQRAFERELTELALNDPLTGLPNRTLFQDRVSRALARRQRRGAPAGSGVAALLVDLDNFKLINDSLGHQTGDELLILVAERLRGCLRTEDTLARMGGDELGILLEDAGSEAEVVAVAERILQALREPFRIGRRTLFTTASIGIALGGPTADYSAGLLRDADLALYQAKARGKARWALFDPGLNAAAHERLELETALRSALARGELWLAYQPIIDLASGEIREVEALLRWRRPSHGDVSPGRFIPLAEELGLIGQIGGWALREACRQAAAWRSEHPYHAPLMVSVNLSGRQLQDPGVVAMVAQALALSGLESRLLKLELTESVLMESATDTIETLRRLKALGVQLAIDDFGTGYSSLAYLKEFPVDVLKIDRSFVDGIGRDARDQSIIQGIIALAGSLGLAVTAEGVETAEQASCLQRLGCDFAQGYYYARPQPPVAISERLTRDWASPRQASIA